MEIVINYWAVLVAAVVSFVLGFLWYGPLFGAPWKKMMGFTDESMKVMKMTLTQAIVGGFIASLLMSYVLAHSLIFASAYLNIEGVQAGLTAGFWNWLGFIVPVTVGVVLWEGKPWSLWVLNSGYHLVSLLLMGAILSLWA